MKKILLLSAVLLGAVTASQAGVRFSIGIPFPAPPTVVVAPAPVYVQPEYCPPPPVVVSPPVLSFGFGGYHRPYYRDYDDYRDYRRPYWRHERHEREEHEEHEHGGYHHRW